MAEVNYMRVRARSALCEGLGDVARHCRDDAFQPHVSVPLVSSSCAWLWGDAAAPAARQPAGARERGRVCSLACRTNEQE